MPEKGKIICPGCGDPVEPDQDRCPRCRVSRSEHRSFRTQILVALLVMAMVMGLVIALLPRLVPNAPR